MSIRALAPHQAKPGLLSGGVSSIKEPPANGLRLPGFRIASRATHRRQEIRSPPDRSRFAKDAGRLGYRAMGALGKCCGSRNLFSRRQKPAPEMAQRQQLTGLEILCEVATAKSIIVPFERKNFPLRRTS